ncbi:MAG: hypothetical protein BWZ10_01240 [candidate division BRC1 bacterium ADurb.BinA364]|nr:MAG: hypothetical protein BWZ10_01240 [candidate division BRC1 bacterium ADurb.BinA364]
MGRPRARFGFGECLRNPCGRRDRGRSAPLQHDAIRRRACLLQGVRRRRFCSSGQPRALVARTGFAIKRPSADSCAPPGFPGGIRRHGFAAELDRHRFHGHARQQRVCPFRQKQRQRPGPSADRRGGPRVRFRDGPGPIAPRLRRCRDRPVVLHRQFLSRPAVSARIRRGGGELSARQLRPRRGRRGRRLGPGAGWRLGRQREQRQFPANLRRRARPHADVRLERPQSRPRRQPRRTDRRSRINPRAVLAAAFAARRPGLDAKRRHGRRLERFLLAGAAGMRRRRPRRRVSDRAVCHLSGQHGLHLELLFWHSPLSLLRQPSTQSADAERYRSEPDRSSLAQRSALLAAFQLSADQRQSGPPPRRNLVLGAVGMPYGADPEAWLRGQRSGDAAGGGRHEAVARRPDLPRGA